MDYTAMDIDGVNEFIDELFYKESLNDRADDYQSLVDEMNGNERYYE